MISPVYVPFYKRSNLVRIVFYTLICCLLLSAPTMAAPVTIDDIEVDVSAKNAVEAREKAFQEAQIKGYTKLAEKMLTEEELESFETPDIKTVSRYVMDFEVTDERLSATRYSGTYRIRYDNSGFKRKPKQAEQNNSQSSNTANTVGNILVIPFFEDAGYPMLWRTNPFLQAWMRAKEAGRAAPAVVPRGDMQDISAIKDHEALQYNPQSLLALKQRYRTPYAAILLARPELMPDGRQNLSISIYQTKSYGPELAQQISVRSEAGETSKSFYDRSVNEVKNVFTQKWKRKTAVPAQQPPQASLQQPLTGPVNNLIAQVGFSNMKQWLNTKAAIERANGVRGVTVKSLSSRGATLGIAYQGGVENLRASLRDNGVGMNDPLTQSAGAATENSFIYKLTPTR